MSEGISDFEIATAKLEQVLKELDLAMQEVRRYWDKLTESLKVAENMEGFWKSQRSGAER